MICCDSCDNLNTASNKHHKVTINTASPTEHHLQDKKCQLPANDWWYVAGQHKASKALETR